MIFLGIDCGTQSTKTIALDWESGEILASAQKAYGFVPNLPPGAMEQDPKDWIEAAEQSIGEVIAKLGALKDEVRGIGVSGQQHGLVVLDQEDRVVRPAKLWNDTTTSSQCDQITDHFGGPAGVIALVGNTMRTGYTAPKILWLRQNEPENWKRTRSILLPHDYLNFWLTGAKKMEFGDASGTALLDVNTRQWSMKLVDYIADDLSEKLPLLISSKLPNGSGVSRGLTRTTFTPPHMARAAFEGVTLGLGYGLPRFRDLGMHPAEIRLTGGGSNSRLWRQMCPDVFGVPPVCLQSGEGSGLGGAIQAGWVWNNEQGSGATLAEICERLVQADETSRNEPDANASEVYSDALNRTSEIRKAFSEAKLI